MLSRPPKGATKFRAWDEGERKLAATIAVPEIELRAGFTLPAWLLSTHLQSQSRSGTYPLARLLSRLGFAFRAGMGVPTEQILAALAAIEVAHDKYLVGQSSSHGNRAGGVEYHCEGGSAAEHGQSRPRRPLHCCRPISSECWRSGRWISTKNYPASMRRWRAYGERTEPRNLNPFILKTKVKWNEQI